MLLLRENHFVGDNIAADTLRSLTEDKYVAGPNNTMTNAYTEQQIYDQRIIIK